MSDPIGRGRTFSGNFGGSIEDGDCGGAFNGDFGGIMEDDGEQQRREEFGCLNITD